MWYISYGGNDCRIYPNQIFNQAIISHLDVYKYLPYSIIHLLTKCSPCLNKFSKNYVSIKYPEVKLVMLDSNNQQLTYTHVDQK